VLVPDEELDAAAGEIAYDAQDRLLSYGSTAYYYLPTGELWVRDDERGRMTFEYDDLGNLLGVGLADTTSIEYVLDGNYRRVGKLDGSGALVQGFLYQDQLNPVAELDANGSVVSRFVYASKPNVPDYLVSKKLGGNWKVYRLLSDHLGSVRLVVELTTGDVARRYDYTPFGVMTEYDGTGTEITGGGVRFQPFGFAGGIFDADTGLVRFGARDYDPDIGRWTTKDPILFAGGDTNLYAYVGNDPVNYLDVDGTVGPIIWAAAVITALAYTAAVTFGFIASYEQEGKPPLPKGSWPGTLPGTQSTSPSRLPRTVAPISGCK
jgi:RHS repeat-associated protein